jgi:tetratricopeptide (TPR) repeat protein
MSADKIHSNYSKGSVVKEKTPYKIMYLAVLWPSWTAQLPQYTYDDESPFQQVSSMTRKFLQEKANYNSLAAQTVIMCLEIVADDNETAYRKDEKRNHKMDWANEEEEELVTEAWTFVSDKLDWNKWTVLYKEVRTNMLIVHDPVVSTIYATRTVFSLTDDQIRQACHVLQEMEKRTVSPNAHALSQALQEVATCPYGVLVEAPFCSQFQHSCLPNVALECKISSPSTVQWIALYDLQVGEEVTVSLVDVSLPPKQVDSGLKERHGPSFSCQCVKCLPKNVTSVTDMQRLGHVALQEERYDTAREWYQRALAVDDRLADVWHALGAIPLHQKRFVEAQRIWREAAEKHPTHAGIALQLEKIKAYRYFDLKTSKESPLMPAYVGYFSSDLCFVTKDPILSPDKCLKVIDSAEQYVEEWTTSRHYAVPTNDVPIHRVPPLLSWFVTWMESTVYPLLAHQFGLRPHHFYVHDAFVVRYEASEHNHLPCHYDESTHSLVLSLNDDFEGGGTYFCDHDTTIRPKQGALVSFCGNRLRHGGNVVTKGVRYILAVFLYYDPDDEKKKRLALARVFETSKKSRFSFEFSL